MEGISLLLTAFNVTEVFHSVKLEQSEMVRITGNAPVSQDRQSSVILLYETPINGHPKETRTLFF